MQNKRREIIKLGAAAGALALAPAGGRLFASTLAPGTSAAALGYWQGGVALADFSSVHAGWVAACPKSARECELPLQGRLTDAALVAGRAGDYLLRIVGGELADVLSIDAHYGTARHMLWRSWREDDAIRHGGAVQIRWNAPAGEGLPLSVQRDSAVTMIQVPAQPGAYVLLPQSPANWRELHLQAPDAAKPLNLRLQAVRSQTPAYLLLTVERLEAAAA